MTQNLRGTPGKSLLPSEVSRWFSRDYFGDCWAGNLRTWIINWTSRSWRNESRKSWPEDLLCSEISGHPHATFLSEIRNWLA